MNDKIDYRPAIDRISEMLDCLPGKAPERVAELLERQRARPASEPPGDDRGVLAYCSSGPTDEHACWLFVQFTDGMWYMDNLDFTIPDVVVWCELPPTPDVKE